MKYIVVTGGAGFIGSHVVEKLIASSKFKIISYDNYSTGLKKNHIKSNRVKYIKGHTKDFSKKFKKIHKKISCIFHFAEFSRIAQSFILTKKCFESNFVGSNDVINFCKEYKIKIIYSATSASLGNNGLDQNLSPYAFSKSTNMNLIMNYHDWFGLKYEIIYFYNVYGPRQIIGTNMSAVIGIFEDRKIRKKSLPVVKPGTQTRRFTHVSDTADACIYAWKKNKNAHYSISSSKFYSIIQLTKLFKSRYHLVPFRKGERLKSTRMRFVRNKKIINLNAKTRLSDYISRFLKRLR